LPLPLPPGKPRLQPWPSDPTNYTGLQPWGDAFFSQLIPETGKPQNKVEKVGVFLATQQAPHRTPQLPRFPPQTHHVFTTTKHHKNAKPPAKTTHFPAKIFFLEDKR
jgi:hypothetical protein